MMKMRNVLMKKNLITLLSVAALISSATSSAFAAEAPENLENPLKKDVSDVVSDVKDLNDVQESINKKPLQTEQIEQVNDQAQIIHFSVPQNEEQPDYLVGGVIRDVAQKILPVSIEARYYAPHFNARVKSDSIRYNGGEVNLKDDLGFGNDKAPEVIFRYKRFTADYIHVHGAGSKSLGGNTLRFGGTTFAGRAHAQSDFHYLKLNVSNPIISVLGTGVDWSYGLTGIYWKGKVRGTNAYTGTSASRSKEYGAPIPTIGLGAHVALLPSLSVYANASGLPLGGYGHFYDVEAGLRYTPLELVGITVGFRRIDVELKHDDDSAKLRLNGPYAGVRVDF